MKLAPVEAVICTGGGIQANLAEALRKAVVPLHILRSEAPADTIEEPRREPVKRTANGDELPPF